MYSPERYLELSQTFLAKIANDTRKEKLSFAQFSTRIS